MKKRPKNLRQRGSISVLVLVFGVVFSSVIGGLAIYGAVEFNGVRRTEAYQKALAVAEAGVYYYRWHLAHDPMDFNDGTCDPGPCQDGPFEHEYNDPQAGIAGSYSLNIIPPEEGSEIVTIESTGWMSDYPSVRRKVVARFGPEPLTKYSFLHNANVWFGQGLTVYGEVFSNGGIRFDGINESIVRSSRDTYTCGSETGCSPAQNRPGVWGVGGPQGLWEFPVPVFDFDSVVTDFNAMKTAAQSDGVYYGPSGSWGYRVIFNNDGTFLIYRVTSASNRTGYSVEDGCYSMREAISGQQLLGTYSVDDNRIIYLEDTTWVEGVVSGETTLVAARLPAATFTTDVYINDNLEYDTLDGTTSLGLIAQNNIFYLRDIPNDFVINAAMMAQQGRILRRYYGSGCGSSSYGIRDSLTIFGSVISNQKSYWNYSGYYGLSSGFEEREITFNQQASDEPPPYFPSTETYRILSWEEGEI